MKIWLVKHKGADYWGNYTHTVLMTVDGKEVYGQVCFYRKKDAVAYLKEMDYPEYYEVVGKS